MLRFRSLEELGLTPSSLEPFISRKTMLVHHGVNYRNYVTRANDLQREFGLSYDDPWELAMWCEQQPFRLQRTDVLFNMAAQVFNHEFYWAGLSATPTEFHSRRLTALLKAAGGVRGLLDDVREAAKQVFGSGWVWIVYDAGALSVVTTANGDFPLNPVWTCDLWEHAYHCDYDGDRASYVTNTVTNLINWKIVKARLEVML
jgi:Fe-Mn family superoxide dismutase